jgi:hypothetical protein
MKFLLTILLLMMFCMPVQALDVFNQPPYSKSSSTVLAVGTKGTPIYTGFDNTCTGVVLQDFTCGGDGSIVAPYNASRMAKITVTVTPGIVYDITYTQTGIVSGTYSNIYYYDNTTYVFGFTHGVSGTVSHYITPSTTSLIVAFDYNSSTETDILKITKLSITPITGVNVFGGQLNRFTAPIVINTNQQMTGVYKGISFVPVNPQEATGTDYSGIWWAQDTLYVGDYNRNYPVTISGSYINFKSDNIFRITDTNHWSANGTTPVLTNCGNSSSITGNDHIGIFVIGSTGTGCILTFATEYGTPPACNVQAETLSNLTSYISSATAITVIGSPGTYHYNCTGINEW